MKKLITYPNRKIAILKFKSEYSDCSHCDYNQETKAIYDTTEFVDVSHQDFMYLTQYLYRLNKDGYYYRLIEQPTINGKHEEFVKFSVENIKQQLEKDEKQREKDKKEWDKKQKEKKNKADEKKKLKEALKKIKPEQLNTLLATLNKPNPVQDDEDDSDGRNVVTKVIER